VNASRDRRKLARMGRGVTCPQCGGSTPLPDDLRVPTFACSFCHATLETAAFAGRGAVTAEGIARHLEGALDMTAREAIDGASSLQRFEDRNTDHREAPCKLCGATLHVPLALEVHVVTCGGCGREQRIDVYVSDAERLDLDLTRQREENAALDRLIASGVACGRCGGHNAVPDDGSAQLVCTHCRAAILLAEHVPAGAIARRRLKHAALGFRDAALAHDAANQAHARRVGLIVLVLCVVGAAIAIALTSS
jgi:hypothetical protein